MDPANFHTQRSAPLWALALSAALVAASFRRHDEAGSPPEREHGRAGKTEADAPERGWIEVLQQVYKRFSEDRVMSIAGGVTFFVLLAIFPAIAALVSIYGLFADPASLADQVNQLSDILPGGTIDVLGEQMRRVSAQGGTTLGITFLISLAISLWSANSGMKATFDALNIVHDEKEKRGLFRLNAVSLVFTILGLVFILIALAAVVVLPILLSYIGLESTIHQALQFGRWPLLLAGIALALAVLYRFGPDRQHAKWRWITWGSATAALLWLAASAICRQFRQLQQDLWDARCRDRLHDVDVDFRNGPSCRRRARCRTRVSGPFHAQAPDWGARPRSLADWKRCMPHSASSEGSRRASANWAHLTSGADAFVTRAQGGAIHQRKTGATTAIRCGCLFWQSRETPLSYCGDRHTHRRGGHDRRR